MEKKCKNCEKIIKHFKVYCDKNCYELYKEKLTDQNFINGELKDNKSIKKALLRLEGDICVICKNVNSIWNGLPLSLQVDHIDGDSDNNKANNLRLVCPNCHSQLDTSKNKTRKETKRNSYLRKNKGYL